MTITDTREGSFLTVFVEGRLDTVTAPELEGFLSHSLNGVENLVFDFKDLEYVSSAGLRVILSTQKTMSKQGSMKVTNVNETVMEVLDITGFSDILTIE
ncbi:MAG: STAS domain-containing protein [Parasporobacterium sp.]|nr:STAS domain-containing protein [Parasporobacterium sp.]